LISSKFLPQKLKNGFAAGDARWRVHSVTPPEEHKALSDVEPIFVLKATKLRKIGLKPLGKKIRSSCKAAAANFFSKRYKGHRGCPLLAAAIVGLYSQGI